MKFLFECDSNMLCPIMTLKLESHRYMTLEVCQSFVNIQYGKASIPPPWASDLSEKRSRHPYIFEWISDSVTKKENFGDSRPWYRAGEEDGIDEGEWQIPFIAFLKPLTWGLPVARNYASALVPSHIARLPISVLRTFRVIPRRDEARNSKLMYPSHSGRQLQHFILRFYCSTLGRNKF